MKIETLRERKDLLMREIERDQIELKSAFFDLKESASVSRRIKESPKAWFFGALVAGFVIGEFS